MFHKWFGTAAAAAVMALAASVATAGPLPPSTATYTLTESYPVVTNYTNAILPVGSYRNDTDGYGDDVYGFTVANFNGGGPAAYVESTASGAGEVSLKYYYEITGPVGQDVKIDLSGSVYAFGYPYPDPGTAWAGISGSIGVPVSGFYAEGCDSYEGACSAGENSGTTPMNVSFNVPTNTFEWIDLDVRVDGQDYGSEFVAQADPIISLDASVSDPQAYQILVSPDVMNGSPAPEPSTWAELLLGAVLVGAGLRRRSPTLASSR